MVHHDLASSVRLPSILLIMQMHHNHLLFLFRFMDPTMEPFCIEFEQQRDKGLQRESEPSAAKSPSELQIPDDLVNKAKTRKQLREETNIHEEYSDSQVTCDGS